MITWILAIFLLLWLVAERVFKKKKIIGVPLGLPEGSIRACIALLVVTFPLNQLIMYEIFNPLFPITIQEWFVNTLFVVVAFYFEARAYEKTIRQLLKEVKDPAKYKKTRTELPLYWPRFTVRISLFLFLILTVILVGAGMFSGTLEFVSTSSVLIELIFIVFFFIVGLLIRRMQQGQMKRKIRKRLAKHEGSHEELVEVLEKKERKNGRITEAILAIIMVGVLVMVLIFYTIDWNYNLFFIPLINVQVSLRMGMVLLLNLYFGYRQ